MNRTLRTLALIALLATAACGGSDESSDTTAASSTSTGSTELATTTAPPTTEAVTTTTMAPVPVYPLTGLPITDGAIAARPALVVKIDNNKAARPQSGLITADIVFEEIVEVQTRFAAVFHSQGADPVGPIRSGRTQDVQLLGSFNRPLFLWSGGNPAVTRDIRGSDFVNLSAQDGASYRGAGFFRSDQRDAPHDLYASTTSAWTLAPAGATAPPQQFQYRPADASPLGDTAAGADLNMDGLAIEWRYDAASGSYLRSNGGTPHNDALTGTQINTQNVIVMVVDYQPSPADANSPEAQTIGSGEALIFTGGTLQRGMWSRTDRLSPISFTDGAGNPLLLTPGRTWVELARVNTTTVV